MVMMVVEIGTVHGRNGTTVAPLVPPHLLKYIRYELPVVGVQGVLSEFLRYEYSMK